jgi:hypothetical protein
MRSLVAAIAVAVLVAVPTVSAAPASVTRAANAKTCVPWPATVLGSRSGLTTVAPSTDCRGEGVPAGPAASLPRGATGIAGTVRRGPIRPVCIAGLPCDAPAAGVIVEVRSGRAVVARLRTGKAGRFLLYVGPGTYVARIVAKRAAPVVVRVRAGSLTHVALSIDTGIR